MNAVHLLKQLSHILKVIKDTNVPTAYNLCYQIHTLLYISLFCVVLAVIYSLFKKVDIQMELRCNEIK